jgi:hypothetical protein
MCVCVFVCCGAGVAGSEDTFQSRLPTYSTANDSCSSGDSASGGGGDGDSDSDLVSTLAYYLGRPALRQALALQLQAEVREKVSVVIISGGLQQE